MTYVCIWRCRNAASRSGLFCVVSLLLEKIEAEGQVSVSNTVRQVRTRSMTIPYKVRCIMEQSLMIKSDHYCWSLLRLLKMELYGHILNLDFKSHLQLDPTKYTYHGIWTKTNYNRQTDNLLQMCTTTTSTHIFYCQRDKQTKNKHMNK